MEQEKSDQVQVREVRSRRGALLARLIGDDLEFKCRRSRTTVRVPLRELLAASKSPRSDVIWVGPDMDSTSS
ncbi:MAG: hypothetical protein R3E97_04105 [Candidatus Eisenbacteria bacterium]